MGVPEGAVDAEAAPAPGRKEKGGGKKPSAAVRKMQEALERQQRLEEEARLAAEEALRKARSRMHPACSALCWWPAHAPMLVICPKSKAALY